MSLNSRYDNIQGNQRQGNQTLLTQNQRSQQTLQTNNTLSSGIIIGLIIVSVILCGLLIWNIFSMKSKKNEICSLDQKCITQPPQTQVSAQEALEAVNALKKDTVEGFLESVNETSQQDQDVDADLLSSLIKSDIETQKQQGIENPTINIDKLIQDARTSFKNSDAVVSLIQQKIEKPKDEFEAQLLITKPPVEDCSTILQEKESQINQLKDRNTEINTLLQQSRDKFVAKELITPTPFIDYKNILEERKMEIKKLKTDIETLQERNRKIDDMLTRRKEEIIQKEKEIQDIKKSSLSKQEKIKQIKSLVKEKNKTINDIKILLDTKDGKIISLQDTLEKRRVEILQKEKEIQDIKNSSLSKQEKIKQIQSLVEEKDKKIDEMNKLVAIKENRIDSLTNELKETVPKAEFNRLKQLTNEGNEETAKALKEMLGLNNLIVMSNYGSSPIPNEVIFPENLKEKEAILSTDRDRLLVHQSDGNIVSYDTTKNLKNNGNGTYSGTAVWASDTSPYNKKNKNYSFKWNKVQLKSNEIVLRGRRIKSWTTYWGSPRSQQNNKQIKSETKLSQNFNNDSIEIIYEVKKGSNWVKIL